MLRIRSESWNPELSWRLEYTSTIGDWRLAIGDSIQRDLRRSRRIEPQRKVDNGLQTTDIFVNRNSQI
jgi:hypothetical protein